MRQASTYRGARRNHARKHRALGDWRASARHVTAANFVAKLYERSVMANAAREAASKAIMFAKNAGIPLAGVAHAAFVAFYSAQKRTRVVGRILRDLGPLPKAKASARGANVVQAPDDVTRAATAYREHGSERKAANALGIAKTTLRNRLMRAAERGLIALGRARAV